MLTVEKNSYIDNSLFFSVVEQYRRQTQQAFTHEDWIHRSYIPLYDRYHIERLKNAGREDDLQKYLQEMHVNIETNLKERFHVVESNGKFIIKDNNIFSEYFPEEPFGQVMLRGASMRKQKGSPESEREGWEGELGGWYTIQSTFLHADTPVHSNIVLFSPPGLVEDTAYTGKFVDIFELVLEGNERCVKRTRLSVSYDYDQYKKKALLLNEHYFDTYDGRPLDAWYLSHPIATSQHVYSFFKTSDGMSEELFQRVFNDSQLQGFIGAYKDAIYASRINWEDVQIAFNAILNRADDIVDKNLHTRQLVSENRTDVHHLIHDIYHYGLLPVKPVFGGGCPTNKGFSLEFNQFDTQSIFANSIVQFANEYASSPSWEYHVGSCVICKKDPTSVGPCSICTECEKKF
jgi:hypothetical protein